MSALKCRLKDEHLIFSLKKNFLKDYVELLVWAWKDVQIKEEGALCHEGRKYSDKKRPHDDDHGAQKERGESRPQTQRKAKRSPHHFSDYTPLSTTHVQILMEIEGKDIL